MYFRNDETTKIIDQIEMRSALFGVRDYSYTIEANTFVPSSTLYGRTS
jgi:hypothetical protein